ncbi:diguanylate cyclase [Solemya velesiana gill symbiont]|uniref:Diguanylate cyclase n=1 Tax=Solemya velesiana gill symbiont TaxID=1918948 RepID=A0A1T2KRG3_9GAMM|nr:diguanylate cyclase [Solemya velesiana gill symbiont]OOZ35391.1 hypothetical protein BOW51_11345 [Solemya velesiana gill symbiont]
MPEVNLDEFSDGEKALWEEILKLFDSRNELQARYRRSMAQLLADADALTETLGRIGLGDFNAPVADINHPGLKTVSIGIEDMVRQLKQSQDELNKLIMELRLSEEKFRQLVESTNDWIWEVDSNGAFRYSSPQVESILGYKPEEMIGRTPFEMMPEKEGKKLLAAFNEWKKRAALITRIENVNLHKDGRRVILETSGAPFFNEHGEVIGYRGVDRDITDRKRMEDRLRHLASHDALTGAYNRQVFQERIREEMDRAERYDLTLSIFMLDIDHFKRVNDSFGHSAGDRVLRDTAQILEKTIRKTDFIARYGGEEFTAILPETGLVNARELAERLRSRISEYNFRIGGSKALKLSASIGVAAYPEHAQSAQDLVDAADSAMYAAKAAGRNKVKTA